MQWLKLQGATEIFLFGDSSGGTQVIQTLLWMEHKRQTGADPGVRVSAAVTFSGWMDMTASGTTYVLGPRNSWPIRLEESDR